MSWGASVDLALRTAARIDPHRKQIVQTYPRYSTTSFLSRTATDEPGSARQSVALEPSSKAILNSASAFLNGFHFAARRYRCSSGCLDLHARLIVEQNQNTPCPDRCDLQYPAGDNFRKFLVSWHDLLARSTCRGIPVIKRVQLRHEFALFSFTVIA